MMYPVVLAAMIGVFRIGRSERWGSLEWMRLGALSLLFGLVVAVQVKLAFLGLLWAPLPLVSALVSLVGVGLLVGLYLWERWQERRATLSAVA